MTRPQRPHAEDIGDAPPPCKRGGRPVAGFRREDDVDPVAERGVAWPRHRLGDVVGCLDDRLREEEAKRECLVVAGRAHDHGERLAVQAHLERRLDGDTVDAGVDAVWPEGGQS